MRISAIVETGPKWFNFQQFTLTYYLLLKMLSLTSTSLFLSWTHTGRLCCTNISPHTYERVRNIES